MSYREIRTYNFGPKKAFTAEYDRGQLKMRHPSSKKTSLINSINEDFMKWLFKKLETVKLNERLLKYKK